MNDAGASAGEASRFDRIVRGLALVGGLVLLAMVLLTVADVVARKIANAPIFGVQNISELALVVVVFAAMAYCGRERGHVAVDLIGAFAGPRVLRITDTLVSLIGAAIFFILTWRALVAAGHTFSSGRVSNLLDIPHWPFYGVIALGSMLYALVQVIDAWRAARGPRRSGG